ncbi:CoA-binding protein [Ekhidna sp.]|uniref:CoA-binding protein n=1 Tax=Ekhidna sp. TaxID=2608089 RepID=UPI0035134C40
MSKKTAIFGATTNPSRYAYLAAERLISHNHEIVPIGIKKGNIFGTSILDLREKPDIKAIDTITMYIGPQNQAEWEEYILSLNPKRIIFNPGSENRSLAEKASRRGIEVLNACTLVMLGNGLF